MISTLTILKKEYEGGESKVNVITFSYPVKGPSGTYDITKYRYTYTDGRKRLTSRDFRSMEDLIKDKKKKTSKV